MAYSGTPIRAIDDRWWLVCPQHGKVPVSSASYQLCPYCAHARPVPKRPRREVADQPQLDAPIHDGSAKGGLS
jgi:hypothetical protein